MMPAQDDKFVFPAWGASLAIHAVAVGLAVMFAAQVKPVLQEEIFKWEVALIQAAVPEPRLAQPTPIEKPAQPVPRVVPAPRVEQRSDMVMTPVAPQQTVQMVHPVIEPPKPIEQKVETPPQKVEPIERKVVEVEQPKVEPAMQPIVEAKESTPAATAEPIVPQSHPVAMATPAETAVESHQSHSEPVVHSAHQSLSHEISAPPSPQETVESPKAVAAIPSIASPSSATSTDAPVQVATAMAPGPEVKADHRWLAESLWRRVAELKRYPSSARLNGQEGKVILKAVIRSDGHLAEVSIQKSSGHAVLDTAAMEAVKLACPLHMKHAIGKPQIVVSLPIVYSLAN